MKTTLKIGLGIALGGVLLIGGCIALIGSAANDASKSLNEGVPEI